MPIHCHRLALPFCRSIALHLALASIIGCSFSGCSSTSSTTPSTASTSSTSVSQNANHSTQSTSQPNGLGSFTLVSHAAKSISAQGRIQPATGIVRVTAIPGDRIEKVLVKTGDQVKADQSLVQLQSEQLRRLELETAQLKLAEANSAWNAKKTEADLAIQTAQLKLTMAEQQLVQATAQSEILGANSDQIESLGKQIDALERLRLDPLTKAAIGTIELETKRADLVKAKTAFRQSEISVENGISAAKLQLQQAKQLVEAALTTRRLVDDSSTVVTLQKQIEMLDLQWKQSVVTAPIDGVVLSVNVENGERAAQLPLVEIADLRFLVCVAEVHEADVGRVAIGDRAELKSAALAKVIRGQVTRVDRTVGSAQLRFPNPMARSDFRSVLVWIAIDPEDVAVASGRIQLQVDVSIATSN